ncbi:sugar-binding protein [Cohnella yongneupensis]|uniref:Sugar-binding protein n=1 Tax=Cohnella yongneupensis TaxID=425006 RepID=A0ABW0R4Q4_9BACL
MKSLKKCVTGFVSSALIFGVASVASAAAPADASIGYAQKAPVIDGKVDKAWSTAKLHKIENFPAPTPGNKFTAPKDAADLSGSWKAMWDDKNLYILVQVTDNKKVKDIAPPKGDGIELYIDPDNSKDNGMGVNDSVWQLGYGSDKMAGWTGNNWATPDVKGAKFKQTDTDKGYIVEYAIPWKNVLGNKIGTYKKIGFDVMLNDNDDGKDKHAKLSWHSKSDDAWEKASLIGTVQLTGKKK